MNDMLEDELRTALNERAAGLPAERVERLARTDYRPALSRWRRVRRPVWPAVGGLGAAVAGGALAAVLVFSSGTTVASGYAAVPTTPAPASVTAAAGTCAHSFHVTAGSPALLNLANAFNGQPVLTETRGIYQALIEVLDGNTYSCLIRGTRGDPRHPNAGFAIHVALYEPTHGQVGPGQISAPYVIRFGAGGGTGLAPLVGSTPAQAQAQIRRREGAGYGPAILGRAGSDVSALSISFANGQTVAATIQNGLYFAWWPWTSDPTSVTVTTSSGTVTSPVTDGGLVALITACQPGSSGCVFANTNKDSPATTAPVPAAPTTTTPKSSTTTTRSTS